MLTVADKARLFCGREYPYLGHDSIITIIPKKSTRVARSLSLRLKRSLVRFMVALPVVFSTDFADMPVSAFTLQYILNTGLLAFPSLRECSP